MAQCKFVRPQLVTTQVADNQLKPQRLQVLPCYK